MAISADREYRSFDFNAPADEMRIEGVPVVFDQPTVLATIGGVEYREIIQSGALDGTDMTDVVLVIDHQGKPGAKTKNNTLQLRVGADGLYMNADLSKNATGREMYEDVTNGFYDKMSFAFTVADEVYVHEKDSSTRIIKRIKELFDVSVVTRPAYSQTSVMARSWAEAEDEARQKAMEFAELRKQLILKTYF